MLDQRTVRFGRTGKISTDSFQKSFFEWEAVRFEVDKICKEEPFICPACTPDILAVSVDENRKLYRFKNAARSEEQAIFEDVFIAKDEDVTRFVVYIHKASKHVSERGVCGGEWSAERPPKDLLARGGFAYPLYLQRIAKSCPELQHFLNMKPFLLVFHAKAHDCKCEVKWSGAYQDGAGLTLGEEVEQCNAFLSRIAVTTKHMSKAGRTDMLTLMTMRCNQQKFNNLATALNRR
ncbi:ATP-binding cassette sub-family D member 3, partial [Tachysurus ichikawai]